MPTHFPLLPRECVVTASALQDDREGIGPRRPDSTIAPGRESTFTRNDGARPGIAHLLSALRGQYLWLTIKLSLMVMGAQGGVWAVNFRMPTYLRPVRHLSASNTGLYVAVQAGGAPRLPKQSFAT